MRHTNDPNNPFRKLALEIELTAVLNTDYYYYFQSQRTPDDWQ